MSEQIEHHCGLVLVHGSAYASDMASLAEKIGSHQANRGQDAAGFAAVTPYGLQCRKAIGSIGDRILQNAAHETYCQTIIVHNRYKTRGLLNATQPFDYYNGTHSLAIGHNGTVLEEPLREYLASLGGDISNIRSDSDLIGRCMHNSLTQNQMSVRNAVQKLWPHLIGAHNVVMIQGDGTAAVWRDSHAKHPLFYAKHNGWHIVASEDNALRQVMGNDIGIEEIPAATLNIFEIDSTRSIEQIADPKLSHCIFEWFYFMKRLSSMAKARADSVRTRSGEIHAERDVTLFRQLKREGREPIVVPVPNTAIAFANGYLDGEIRLPRVDAILRKSTPRTFITPRPERERAIQEKYEINFEWFNGKDIFLIDDSLVRGSTLKALVREIRQNSHPRSLHVRLGFPPIIAPCFQGIDMATVNELALTPYRYFLQHGESIEQIEARMAKDFGVDSLSFLPLSRVSDALQLPEDRLCRGCTQGMYDHPEHQQLYQLQLENLTVEGL